MLQGLDDISITERYEDAMKAYESKLAAEMPWLAAAKDGKSLVQKPDGAAADRRRVARAHAAQLMTKRCHPRSSASSSKGFTDCIGVMLAGSREPVTLAVERVLRADQPAGPANLYFSATKTSAPAAAWINGTAAHALDYDDVALKELPSEPQCWSPRYSP